MRPAQKHRPVIMGWTELMFGKHEGKTLPQIVFADTDWFFWAYEAGVLDRHGTMDEAKSVCRRATRIRIPQDGVEKLVAEYALCPTTGMFANVEIVPKSRRHHQGSSPTMRLPVFDLSVPRRFNSYDKAGGKALVNALKVYLFGDRDYRLTKDRCE